MGVAKASVCNLTTRDGAVPFSDGETASALKRGYVRDTRGKVSQAVNGLKTICCKFVQLCQLLPKSAVS
jgi:hypothetical protein